MNKEDIKKDIIEDSLICLANAKLNDTSYEVARDIALDYIIELKERINKALKIIEQKRGEYDIPDELEKVLKGEK